MAVSYTCATCGRITQTHEAMALHKARTGHQTRIAVQVEPKSDTGTATIYNAALTLTCYCHRQVITFVTTRLVVAYWDQTNLSGDFRVSIEMPSEAFHHPDSYAVMVRGETDDFIFAFPFLEIQEIRADGSLLGWIGHFRSKPDKTGTHFATKGKEGSNDQ